jgi:hypothetical protein
VILPSVGVELPVVNANAPSCGCVLWNQLSGYIFYYCKAGLLWNHLSGADPFAI